MKRLALIASLMLCCGIAAAQQGTTVYDSLKSYLEAIGTMPVDSINARCSALIESAADDDTRAKIAGTAFNYFLDSPVMGAEGVSVYIADNYFLNKRLKWPSEATFPSLYTFAEFNRQSLLGCQAPELQLESLQGEKIDVRQFNGGCKILYFYEDACATCARQTPLIASLLKEYSGAAPLALYAVYTQGDRTSWAKYAITHFGGIDNPKVNVYHLWDPEGASEFHKKYSVLTTPSLLLLDADNRIIGRKLDASALAELLHQEQSFTASLYELLDGVRDNMGLDTLSINDVCEAFSSRIGDDPELYRKTFYGIYNYLRAQDNYEAMESAALVGRKYILGQSALWSPEMLSATEEALWRFGLNRLGEKAADVALRNRRGRERMLLEYSGKKYAVLFFNLVSCEQCSSWKAQLRDMKQLLRKSGARVVSVYVGPDREEWLKASRGCRCGWTDLCTDWPESELYSKYDVSIVPKIYLLDAEGTVLAKDITPETLAELLKQ